MEQYGKHFASIFLFFGTFCLAVPAIGANEIYFGVFDHDKMKPFGDLTGVAAFEQDAGKQVAIVHVFQGWGGSEEKRQFNFDAMDAIRRHGSIPLLTWAPRAPDQNESQPAFALHHIIDGEFDEYIVEFAKAVKRWNHPLFLRFAHEMNGDWYPWAEKVNGNGTGEYVRAWRHVHDIFSREQVANVTWVWSPSCVMKTKLQKLRELYPGDEYVDWLAMDGYNDTRKKDWQSLEDVFGDLYDKITLLSSKPVMIAEFSSMEKGGSKPHWIKRALEESLPKHFQRVHAVVWFNRRFGSELDWRIESSLQAQEAFNAAITSPTYLSNSFGTISVSPIPPP